MAGGPSKHLNILLEGPDSYGTSQLEHPLELLWPCERSCYHHMVIRVSAETARGVGRLRFQQAKVRWTCRTASPSKGVTWTIQKGHHYLTLLVGTQTGWSRCPQLAPNLPRRAPQLVLAPECSAAQSPGCAPGPRRVVRQNRVFSFKLKRSLCLLKAPRFQGRWHWHPYMSRYV